MSETFNIPEICSERMGEWAKELAEHEATPMLVVGVGHNQNSGAVHVFTCEQFTDEDILKLLVFALREINRRITQDGRRILEAEGCDLLCNSCGLIYSQLADETGTLAAVELSPLAKAQAAAGNNSRLARWIRRRKTA